MRQLPRFPSRNRHLHRRMPDVVIGNAADELAGEMHGMAMTRMDALAGREL